MAAAAVVVLGGGRKALGTLWSQHTKKKKNMCLFAHFYTQFTFPDIPAAIVTKVQGGKEGGRGRTPPGEARLRLFLEGVADSALISNDGSTIRV